ncbi:hypothetical protein P7C70_g7393, partial [Phenoliferia sp. Uapishka_3]
MSDLSKSLGKISPLSGIDDYASWARKTLNRITIAPNDLQLYVLGENIRPLPAITPGTAATATAFATPDIITNRDAMRAWDSEDGRVLAFLEELTGDLVQFQIAHCETSHEAWTTLERLYRQSSIGLVQSLQQRLSAVRLGPGEDVAHHLTTMASLRSRLAHANVFISELDMGSKLLWSLERGTYKEFVNARGRLPASENTFTQVSQELLQEDQLDRLDEEAEVAAVAKLTALAARATLRGRGPVAAAAAQVLANPLPQSAAGVARNGRGPCANPTCPSPARHDIAHCWAPGGAVAGQRPAAGARAPRGGGRVAPAPAVAAVAAVVVDAESDTESVYPRAATFALSAPGRDGIALSALTSNPLAMIGDSGANVNISKDLPRNYKTFATPKKIALAGAGQFISAPGQGSLSVESPVPNGPSIELKDVLYVPGAAGNLVSLQKLADDGYAIILRKQNGLIVEDSAVKDLKLTGVEMGREDGFWTLVESKKAVRARALAAKLKTRPKTLDQWHRELGHINRRRIIEAARLKTFPGLSLDKIIDPESIIDCRGCHESKGHKTPIARVRASELAAEPFDLVYSDLSGRFPRSIEGFFYYITFVDDASRMVWVDFLVHKSGATPAIKSFFATTKTQYGKVIKEFQSDQGGEYKNERLGKFFKSKGTRHRFPTAREARHNGTPERANRTLKEGMRAAICTAGFAKDTWAHAIRGMARSSNQALASALGGKMSPSQRLTGQAPDLSDEHELGQKLWVHVNEKDRRKGDILAEHSVSARFLCHSPDKNGYVVLLDSPNRRVRTKDSYHVSFVDPVAVLDALDDQPLEPEPAESEPNISNLSEAGGGQLINAPPMVRPFSPVSLVEPQNDAPIAEAPPVDNAPLPVDDLPAAHDATPLIPPPPAPQPAPTHSRPVRVRKPRVIPNVVPTPSDLRKSANAAYLEPRAYLASSVAEPKGHYMAMKSKDADLWKLAEVEEVEALAEAHTWDIMELPDGASLLDGDFVYKEKLGPDGTVVRWKARYVGRGNHQTATEPGRPGDYELTYAPTGQLPDLRLFLSVCVSDGLEVRSYDVKTAFLTADLDRPADRPLFIRLPPGHGRGSVGPTGRLLVGKLVKALYGLKQSGRCWWKRLDAVLTSVGFHRLSSDWGFYVLRGATGVVWLFIFVDNIFAGIGGTLFDDTILPRLNSEFKLTGGAPVEFELGMNFARETPTGPIHISMPFYVDDFVEEFRMSKCNAAATPMVENLQLVKGGPPLPEGITREMYQRLVGKAMWASLTVMPQISTAVGVLSQFGSDPGKDHWDAGLHLVRYMKGARDQGLIFGRTTGELGAYGAEPGEFVVYCDASWLVRRSRAGWASFRGHDLVNWSSTLEPSVALSTAEAELMAFCNGGKEELHLLMKSEELGIDEWKGPGRVYSDNDAALSLAANPSFSQRAKHIDRRWYWSRDWIDRGRLEALHIPGKENPADLFTKPLGRLLQDKFAKALGVCTRPWARKKGAVKVSPSPSRFTEL